MVFITRWNLLSFQGEVWFGWLGFTQNPDYIKINSKNKTEYFRLHDNGGNSICQWRLWDEFKSTNKWPLSNISSLIYLINSFFCLIHAIFTITMTHYCRVQPTHFEDASFLPGDLFNAVSKNLSVVYTQRGDTTHPRPPVDTEHRGQKTLVKFYYNTDKVVNKTVWWQYIRNYTWWWSILLSKSILQCVIGKVLCITICQPRNLVASTLLSIKHI